MIVSLEHVFKYYGADCILRDVNAAINEKDRIGLVGANGEGKTTLLNVLTGGLDYEEGSVSLTNGKVIGYLHQNSGLSNGRTIQQEMEAVFADLIALGQEVDALQKQMAQVHDNPQEYERVSAEYQKKLARFEAKDGYQIEVKINTVLNGMGFGNYDRNIVTNNLSGGEKTRLATARLLLLEPDLLILDEPTNHLDFKTLNWLEDYLSSYKGALLVVSHDRYFLTVWSTTSGSWSGRCSPPAAGTIPPMWCRKRSGWSGSSRNMSSSRSRLNRWRSTWPKISPAPLLPRAPSPASLRWSGWTASRSR